MHGLGIVTSAKLGDGFDLNNNLTIDYQIGFKYANFNIFVGNRKLDFSLKRNIS